MKINLTKSERITLKGALFARYMYANGKIKELKINNFDDISLSFILCHGFYRDMKLDIESIYEKIFKDSIRKESNNDRQ